MAANLIVAPEAEQDMTEAYAWYEGRRPRRGEEFMSCVDAYIQVLCRTPEMHALFHDNYR
jgi:hypothetical protein